MGMFCLGRSGFKKTYGVPTQNGTHVKLKTIQTETWGNHTRCLITVDFVEPHETN